MNSPVTCELGVYVEGLTTSVYGDLLVLGVVPRLFGCIVPQEMSVTPVTDITIDNNTNT